MRETETSAPSLGELSEAATPGRMDLQAFDLDCGGVPLIAVPDDIPVGGTPTNGLVAVATLLPVEWPSDRNEADPRRAQANAAYLVRLWNDHRAGRLIDPTAMAEAVASARAEAIEEFGASTEDELDERIARQGARENMRLIDSISDLIGQPHDVELTKSDVANALASARAEGVKEGLERAAGICEAHAPNISDPYMPRSEAERLDVQDEVCAMLADDIRALIPGGSSDV